MHYSKRLVSIFLLSVLFTLERSFNATPPANAQIRDQDCALHAIAAAAGVTIPQLIHETGLMVGPTHTEETITHALQQVGRGNGRHPRIFYHRDDLNRYLRGNGNAEYIVGWQETRGSTGHVINARSTDRRVTFVDNQSQCPGISNRPPSGQRVAHTYWAWFTKPISKMDFLAEQFGNLTIDNLAQRDVSYGNFTPTCKNITLFSNFPGSNSVKLAAECQNKQKRFKPTIIDLNDIIVNSNGSLQWESGGHFGASVKNCRIEVANYTVMECDAKTNGNIMQKSATNLDTEIENLDGVLTNRLFAP